MVDVLCRAGNVAGAIKLESLWNEAARTHRFSLLCAYRMETFRDGAHTSSVAAICGAHAHVIPTERYTQIPADEQRREITLLQQRALALATEVERSRALERSLRDALHRAESANRAKSEFLAMMSHELRTPLNAIGGHVQLVELELHGPINERQRDALARVQRSQRHLLALINDVLNLARAESGILAISSEAVPVAPVVLEVTELLAPLFTNASLSCDVTVDETAHAPIEARADREKVHQVLLNLLGNALKFTPPGGAVHVHAHRSEAPEASVLIEVTDNGVGIPADKLDEIFQPFVQLGRWSTESRDGIGLGLSISRALARAMGGDLTAASTPSCGSTLTLTLPHA
jgi:signal transduction histidine kinase